MLWVTKTDGQAACRPQRQQFAVEPLPRELIERAERLVHQQQIRRGDERAGDRRTHLHAPRKLAREVAGEIGQADQRERGIDIARGGGARHAGEVERQPDVGRDAGPRHEGRTLEHHRQAASRTAGGVEAVAPPRDRAGIRRDQARHQIEQRRLAAPRRPEQRQELAAAHVEIHRRERVRARAVGLLHAADRDNRRGALTTSVAGEGAPSPRREL